MSADATLCSAEQWVTDNVTIITSSQNGSLAVEARCEFPISANSCYELITHPDNFEIFRNIQRCTFRKVLSNGLGLRPGHHLVEVENESDWNLFVIRGAVKTRMIVEQDMSRGMMHFTLAPNANSPLRELYGRWTITPIASPLTDGSHSSTSPSCCVTLYQRFTPKNMPPFLFNTFARFTVRHLRFTFEDLYSEIHQIKQGRPTLGPFMSACMKEFRAENSSDTLTDPSSVLTALEEASSASTSADERSTRGGGSSRGSSRTSGASMAESSRSGPLSHNISWPNFNEEGIFLADNADPATGYLGKVSRACKTARSAWKSTLRWIDEHIPIDDDTFENAWASAFGDDFPRGLWLVVA